MSSAPPDDPMLSFHASFSLALQGQGSMLTPWLADPNAPGLAVYRNTVAKGRADALAGLYPTVERLVGPDWFRDAALIYADSAPPSSPVLDAYGEGFPEWLATFPPAFELPFLPPVARLDRAWSRAHRAADAPTLRPGTVAALSHTALNAGSAVLHPSAQVFWFDWTAPSIWLANRLAMPSEDILWDQSPEGLLIVRPEMEVQTHRLNRPQFAFLDACRHGRTVGAAALAALAADPAANLSELFRDLLLSGAFTRIDTGAPQ